MTSTSPSLIDLIMSLLRDPAAHAAFTEDPSGWLESCGAGDVTPADIHDALVLVSDNQHGDFSRDYNLGGNHVSVPPPPANHPGESDHEAAVRYLNTYVTNNYQENHTTVLDQSVNQEIDTHGGSFHQNLDNHSVNATGDGAVAAGGDIDGSTVVTGSHNTVGDGNVSGTGNVVGDGNHAVTGSDNTTSFGSGAANSTHAGSVNVGSGGAFNSGSGTTALDNSDHSLHNVGNDSSDHSVSNSGNTAVDQSQTNSHNDSSDHSDNSDHSLHDVANNESDHSDHSTHTVDHSFDHNAI